MAQIGLVEKPADFAERDLGHAFALVLCAPLFGDQPEAIVLGDRGADLRQLPFMRGIEPSCDLAARLLALPPRVARFTSGHAPNESVR